MLNDLFENHNFTAMTKQIAIIGNPNEFLTKSIQEAFAQKQFMVYPCKIAIDDINKVPPTVKLYLLLIGSSTVAGINPVLIYLKDAVLERKICPCIICEKSEVAETYTYLPRDCIARVYERPVNAKEIVTELTKLYEEPILKRRQKTILIVDDDPEYLKAMQQFMRSTYRVYMANSGASALMFLSKHKADLILLDYQMPVLDGIKTMEALRSEPETARIPVMFLTGKQDVGSVAQAVQMKPVKYILKSTPANTIKEILADYFMNEDKKI